MSEPTRWAKNDEDLLGKLNGGADRIRTCDLLIANETLYQLSYDPIHEPSNTYNLFAKSQDPIMTRTFFHSRYSN